MHPLVIIEWFIESCRKFNYFILDGYIFSLLFINGNVFLVLYIAMVVGELTQYTYVFLVIGVFCNLLRKFIKILHRTVNR